MKEYSLYRGLQKPMVFKSFKGKYIYWGVGSIVGGLLSFMVLASVLGLGYGLLSLALITGGGLTLIGLLQKKGLHVKKQEKGIFIYPSKKL